MNNKVIMTLELEATCPECSHKWDLFDDEYSNDEGQLSDALFKNTGKFEFLATCEKCDCEFNITELEW